MNEYNFWAMPCWPFRHDFNWIQVMAKRSAASTLNEIAWLFKICVTLCTTHVAVGYRWFWQIFFLFAWMVLVFFRFHRVSEKETTKKKNNLDSCVIRYIFLFLCGVCVLSAVFLRFECLQTVPTRNFISIVYIFFLFLTLFYDGHLKFLLFCLLMMDSHAPVGIQPCLSKYFIFSFHKLDHES